MTALYTETRKVMTDYWKEHSQNASVEEMMLDESASTMADQESNEIMQMLPDIRGMKVLELGAGIGRFTGLLAENAKQVTANDFMQTFVDKNQETHGHLGNIDYICDDVTKLDFPAESMDLVFSNWLFMYLEDEEVETVLMKVLRWLKKDGLLFFRESCFHQSGNKKRNENPTKYRDPDLYSKLLYSASYPENGNNCWICYDCLFTKPVLTYIKLKGNPNQLAWMVKKTVHEFEGNSVVRTRQDQLDLLYYKSPEMILHSNIVEQSPQSPWIHKDLYSKIGFKKGDLVLDVGCGIGIHTFYIAQAFDARVIGVDFSANMVTLAMKRLNEFRERNVIFEITDIMNARFADDYFDVIHCRDTLFHFNGKEAVLKLLHRWMKPGGRLYLTDYTELTGDGASETPADLNGFHMFDNDSYIKTLNSVGFSDVISQDETNRAVQTLEAGVSVIAEKEKDLLKSHAPDVIESLLDHKRERLEMLKNRQLTWSVMYASKAK